MYGATSNRGAGKPAQCLFFGRNGLMIPVAPEIGPFHQVDGRNGGEDRIQALADRFGLARQVDDERAAAQAGGLARQDGGRHELEGLRPASARQSLGIMRGSHTSVVTSRLALPPGSHILPGRARWILLVLGW